MLAADDHGHSGRYVRKPHGGLVRSMAGPLIRPLIRYIRKLGDERFLRAAAEDCDAVLASYPKCGRTWLRYLLSHYFAELAELDMRPDLVTTFRVLPNFDRDPVRGIPAFAFQGKRPRLPLVLVSHHSYDPALFLDRPVIFLIRDPRDIIVSAYFHATRHKHRFKGSVEAFLNDRSYGLPALINYWNSWADGLAQRRHIILSYEHMLHHTEVPVEQLLAFLGVELRADILDRAIKAARFDRMQKQEMEQGIPGHEYDRSDQQSLRMRSGKAGGYADFLTPEVADLVIIRCREGLTPQAWRMLAPLALDAGGRPDFAASTGCHSLGPPEEIWAGIRATGTSG